MNKSPCFVMALTMVGLARSQTASNRNIPASQTGNAYIGQTTDMNNGTLFCWKIACRSEGITRMPTI